MTSAPTFGLQLRSTVTSSGTLDLGLVLVPVTIPGPNEVVIKVEAAPINPSDLGLLLAGADLDSLESSMFEGSPVISARIEAKTLRALAGRIGESLAVGNEGAGIVILTGSSDHATALFGRSVAAASGAMFSQYRTVDASQCLLLPQGTPARLGASAFVNPLTAMAMVETMRAEGHCALVHTAAASNLGQMLVRLCQEERVPLVNIVRRPEQAVILRELGSEHVVDSSSTTFMSDLIDALRATSATLAFDATGGGSLSGHILTGMEAAANSSGAPYSRYGSSTHKQVYIYGGLDSSPTVLTRNFGFAWGIGGFLLTPFLQKIGVEKFATMRQRVADSLTTTFASSYTREISLSEALEPAVIVQYARQSTGEKFLITPHTT